MLLKLTPLVLVVLVAAPLAAPVAAADIGIPPLDHLYAWQYVDCGESTSWFGIWIASSGHDVYVEDGNVYADYTSTWHQVTWHVNCVGGQKVPTFTVHETDNTKDVRNCVSCTLPVLG